MSEPVIIIPARFSSTRFPGKPLADINGKPMIYHVWNKCVKALHKSRVYVATDDHRIERVCKDLDISVVMTNSQCQTGTDRIFEVSKIIDSKTYINVQGDEPLIKVSDIEKIIDFSINEPDTIIKCYNARC